jgi:hypothetical protein
MNHRHDEKKTARLALRMPEDLHQACKAKAKKGDLNLSMIATRLLKRWVDGKIDVGEEPNYESE